jgi:GntR family transcriptional regulator, transcriptional repressor for pyruvate dehydrogenase complex
MKRARTPGLDIYEIRMMLEPVATARAAMSATGAGLRPAIQLLAAMETETDGTRWAEHNASFHDIIALAGNSPWLVAMLTNLRELSTRYITHSVLAVPDRAQRANAEHEEILRAVVAHDPGAAADAVLRHLDGTLRGPADDPPARCARSRCLLGRRPGASLITCQPGSSSLRVTG